MPFPIKREFLPFFPQKNSLSPFLNCILNILLKSHCIYIVEKNHASFADSSGMIKYHFIAIVDQRQWTFFCLVSFGVFIQLPCWGFLFNPSDLFFLSFLNCLAHQFFMYVLLFLIIFFILFLTVWLLSLFRPFLNDNMQLLQALECLVFKCVKSSADLYSFSCLF